jgi:hypothetical protein
MTATLKAIETRYKNYRFRSRLEARWAVFFDAFDVDWEYEVEGYNLGAAGYYLPDFVVCNGLFVEIKPGDATLGDAYTKCEALHKQSSRDVLLLKGNPRDHIGIVWSSDPDTSLIAAAVFGQCRKCPGLAFGWVSKSGNDSDAAARDAKRAHDFDFDGWHMFGCAPRCKGTTITRGREYDAAVDAAMGARFEHGESGGA